ncbi:MAG: hypothetical protein JO240_09430 [Solirubrobacterales bacterium]|nr:hypothetical protein [Solirubrobacterales bacterium]
MTTRSLERAADVFVLSPQPRSLSKTRDLTRGQRLILLGVDVAVLEPVNVFLSAIDRSPRSSELVGELRFEPAPLLDRQRARARNPVRRGAWLPVRRELRVAF